MEVCKVGELLVVRSKIKEFAKNMNVAGDFADVLSQKVSEMVKQACKRASDNGRKTIQARDL